MAGINGVSAKESKIVTFAYISVPSNLTTYEAPKTSLSLFLPPIFPYLSCNLVFHNTWIARHYLNPDLAYLYIKNRFLFHIYLEV